MFIRAIKNKNKNSSNIYYTHKLIDSVRTQNGPRQKIVLNLGSLDLEQDKWKRLANRIEELITGQKRLTPGEDKEVENLARHYAQLYSQQKIAEDSEQPSREPEFASVDLNAVSSSEAKSIGREYVGFEAMRRLGFPELFRGLGFTSHQMNMAILSVVGRLIRPSSELELKRYARQDSGLDVLLNTDFSHIGQNALYEISDLLLAHKQDIEEFLRTNTKNLLGLSESIIFYDLTNTYFESNVSGCDKAEHGKSKQNETTGPKLHWAVS